MANKKRQVYCFLNGTRPCTLDCRAAYKSNKETYCGIIWTIQEFGYRLSKIEEKIKKVIKTSKKSK